MKNQHTPLLMCIMTTLFWISTYTYIPILTPYATGLGINYTYVGVIVSSYGLMQTLCRIPIGIASDLSGKRKIFILGGIVAAIISGVGLYVATTPVLVLVFRGMAGVSVSVWAIIITTYSASVTSQDHGKAMGIVNAMMALGQLCGLLLGGLVAFLFGYRATFLVGAIAAILAFVLATQLPENGTLCKSGVSLKKILGLVRNKDLLFFSFLGIILQLVIYSGAFGFLSTVLKDLGMNEIVLGIAPAVMSLPTVLSSLMSGTYFKERFGMKQTLIYGFITLAITLLLSVSVKSIVAILILQFVCGFARGLVFPTLTALATQKVPQELRSSATSFFQAAYGIGMTLGPLIIGICADLISITFGFYIVFAAALLGAVMVWFKRFD